MWALSQRWGWNYEKKQMGTVVRVLSFGFISAFVISVLAISGCAGNGEDKGESALESPVSVERVTLTMGLGANNNWPVTVELVRIKKPEQLAQLLRMETDQWFEEQGEVFKQTYLYPEAYYDMWEIVPGTTVGPISVEEADTEVAGVIFCHTRQKALPKRFDIDGDAIVQIGNEGCALSGGTIIGPSDDEGGRQDEESSDDSSVWSYLWPWGE